MVSGGLPAVRVRLLGPVCVVGSGGEPVAVGGPKSKAMLALLALSAGALVTTEQLIDGVWGEGAPAGARNTLQVHVSGLRKLLRQAASANDEQPVLEGSLAGYILRLDRESVDCFAAQRMLVTAQLAASSGDHEQAGLVADTAVAMWSGPELADVGEAPFADLERARLTRLRVDLLEVSADAAIAVGRYAEVIRVAESVLDEQPYHEGWWCRLLIALHHSGRTADALAAYARAQSGLSDELGLDPGPALSALQGSILRGELPTPERLLSPGPDARSFQPATPPKTVIRHAALAAARGRVVGRTRELAELTDLVRGKARLSTLTGLGGTGKTTLALAAAAELEGDFPDGAFVVRLDSVTSADQMWFAIARELDVPADAQVPPKFFEHIAERQALLVLDNLEQIEDADTVVRALMEQTRHLTVLATSRRPLHVEDEHEYAVTPLPDDDAVALFVTLARRVNAGFNLDDDNQADVRQLCAALDCLPLAVELAAARMKMLSPHAVLARIDQILDVASKDRSRTDRQRTVRGAIAWSYHLLPTREQTVLRRLAVFNGGAPLPAVETVVPPTLLEGAELLDILFQLVEASLVTVTEAGDGEPRFSLLKSVQRFALDQFDATDEINEARASHAQYFYDLAADLRQRSDEDYAGCFARWHDELPNLREATGHGFQSLTSPTYPGPIPELHALTLLVSGSMLYNGFHDATTWQRQAWAIAPADTADRCARVALSRAKVELAYYADGDEVACLREAEETWALYEAVANEPLPDVSPPWIDPHRSATAAMSCTIAVLSAAGRLSDTSVWLERMAQVQPHLAGWHRSALPTARAWVAMAERDYDTARANLLEVAQIHEESGAVQAHSHLGLAELDLLTGDAAGAHHRLAAHCEEIIADGDVYLMLQAATLHARAIGVHHPQLAARVLGSVESCRVLEGFSAFPEDEEDQRIDAAIQSTLPDEEWGAAYKQGQEEDLVDLMRTMAVL